MKNIIVTSIIILLCVTNHSLGSEKYWNSLDLGTISLQKNHSCKSKKNTPSNLIPDYTRYTFQESAQQKRNDWRRKNLYKKNKRSTTTSSSSDQEPHAICSQQ